MASIDFEKFKIISKVEGGRMNECFVVTMNENNETDNNKYFLKIKKLSQSNQFKQWNRYCENFKEIFDKEKQSLLFLKKLGFRVPKVVDSGSDFLLLEYIKFANSLNFSLFATTLSKLHNISYDSFGFYSSTFLGEMKLVNDFESDWSSFFKSKRWKPIFDKLLEIDKDIFENYENWVIGIKVYDIISLLFQNVKIIPSLLHGDLNPGNINSESGNDGIDKTNRTDRVVLYDASCYYGHNWYDIAAYTSWKSLPNEFIDKYNISVNNPSLKLDLDHPIFWLYKSYIYLSGYFVEHKVQLLKKSIKLCKKLISLFPTIYPSLNKVEKIDKVQLILIQCGSYNPIHENHLRNLSIAYKHINQPGVHCLLVPASQSRIKQKVGNQPSFNFHQRVKYIEDAIKHCHFPCSIDLCQLFGENLIQHLQITYENPNIIFVCGSDTYLYNRRFIPQRFKFFVIERNDYTIQQSILFQGDILLSNNSETTMSSTAIRKIIF